MKKSIKFDPFAAHGLKKLLNDLHSRIREKQTEII
jgi:hypothetical protein